jgi:hypothetical protein
VTGALRRAALAAALAAALPAAPALPSLAPPAAAGDPKPDLDGLVKFLASFMKKKSLGKRDPEDIGKRLAPIQEDDLSWVLDRLREVPAAGRAEAAAEVERLVEDALLSLRYSPAILRLPDAAKRLSDGAPAARCALLADLSRLEDAEPATRIALWCLEGGALAVRLRAIDVLADLCSWGGNPARLLPALVKALDDPSPAVRDLALERLVDLSEPAALDWALAHLGDGAEETTEVREAKETRCPGNRALELVTRVSKIRWGMDGASFREADEETRRAVEGEFRAWRAKAGANPIRSAGEGPFDPLPRVTSAVVDPAKTSSAALRWWSEVDRAQFRLDVDEIQVVATSRIDWAASFAIRVVASGARQGDWEATARKVRCGGRHRLPRRGFGLIETSIQPLLDGRWKVWVRAYEWRGGG